MLYFPHEDTFDNRLLVLSIYFHREITDPVQIYSEDDIRRFEDQWNDHLFYCRECQEAGYPSPESGHQ